MNNDELTYDRSILIFYKEINEFSFREKVKFVEENRHEINALRNNDRMYIELDFLLSLFQIGDYERFLQFVDQQVENVINHNIFKFKNKDIYFQLLQNKALSLFHLRKDQKGLALALQLRRMSQSSMVIDYIIRNILLRKERLWYRQVHGTVIALAFGAAAVLFMELLVIRPFYPEYISIVEPLRNIMLIISVLLVIINQLALYFMVSREMKKT